MFTSLENVIHGPNFKKRVNEPQEYEKQISSKMER